MQIKQEHAIRIAYSPQTNLIEQSAYRYSLQERSTPNLYRDLFDYQSVPKVSFNHRVVPMQMPAEVWITDTTFRDGQQATKPFTVQQITDLYKMLHRLGGENGLIRQSEFFVYSEKDRAALESCMSLGYQFPEITTWIRASSKDFALVKSLGIRETGVLVSCSDYHIYNKMGLTRAGALDKYLGVIKEILDLGISPRCHFEDITRADYYGFVLPFAEELHRLSEESGIPIKIRACDTMGYGIPYPGAALPRSVAGIVYGLNHYAGFPRSCSNTSAPPMSRRGILKSKSPCGTGGSADSPVPHFLWEAKSRFANPHFAKSPFCENHVLRTPVSREKPLFARKTGFF